MVSFGFRPHTQQTRARLKVVAKPLLSLLLFFLWRYSPIWAVAYLHEIMFHFAFLDFGQSVELPGRVISSSQGLYLYTTTEKRARAHTHTINIHTLREIRTHDPGFRASEDSACLKPLGYRDRFVTVLYFYMQIKASLL
jgi:hypothetical protein